MRVLVWVLVRFALKKVVVGVYFFFKLEMVRVDWPGDGVLHLKRW